MSRSQAQNTDHLTSHDGHPCTTDPNGNLANCDGNTYTYDPNGHLTTATTLTGTVTYSYDAAGRLTARTDNQTTTQYLYANPAVPLQVTATTNGQTTRTYDYDDHGRLLAYHDGAHTTYVITDVRGTPVEFIDETGNATPAPSRDPYGHPTSGAGAGLAIGFAGGLQDPATGLVTFGVRSYDPATGRWLQSDPALVAGGDSNLYRYAAGDPINSMDPTGLIFEGWQDWNLAPLGNFAAGFGNMFIIPTLINEWTGADKFVDECSFSYHAGQAAGFIVSTIILSGASATETAAVKTTRLYRAVEGGELADIIETGAYKSPFGIEGKYFFPSEAQADNFVQLMEKIGAGPFTITSGSIETAALEAIEPITISGEGLAYYLENSILPRITNILIH